MLCGSLCTTADVLVREANALGTVMFIVGILMLVVIRRAFRMNDPIYS